MGMHRARQGVTGRRNLATLLLALLLLTFLAGCGDGGGSESDAEADKAADIEQLNAAYDRQQMMIQTYEAARPYPRGRLGLAARRFLAHQVEYQNAITKAIRGLGGEVDRSTWEVDLYGPRSPREAIEHLYLKESDQLADSVETVARLNLAGPRTLLASLAAGHAQHLVVLRQGLGVSLTDAVPEPFDDGEVPLPEE